LGSNHDIGRFICIEASFEYMILKDWKMVSMVFSGLARSPSLEISTAMTMSHPIFLPHPPPQGSRLLHRRTFCRQFFTGLNTPGMEQLALTACPCSLCRIQPPDRFGHLPPPHRKESQSFHRRMIQGLI